MGLEVDVTTTRGFTSFLRENIKSKNVKALKSSERDARLTCMPPGGGPWGGLPPK